MPPLVLRVVLLALAASLPSALAQNGVGFAFDPCKAGQKCRDELECRVRSGNTPCLPTSKSCFCQSLTFSERECSASTICTPGERCVGIADFEFNICASCKSWPFLPNATVVDRDGNNCLSAENNYTSGYTGDACTSGGDLTPCAAPRECFFPDTDDPLFFKPCFAARTVAERQRCMCRDGDVSTCTTSSECPYGERCVKNGTTSAFCLGCRAVELEVALVPADDDNSRCLLPNSPPSPSPPPPSSDRAPYRGGFAWDDCTVDPGSATENRSATCPKDHYCASSAQDIESIPGTGPPECKSGEESCFCSFNMVRRCTVSTDCTAGERCVKIMDGIDKDLRFCAGCQRAEKQVKSGKWKLLDPDDNCIPLSAKLSPSPTPSAIPAKSSAPAPGAYPRGFTFDECADDREICREPRRCGKNAGDRPCGRDDTTCSCFPSEEDLKMCESSRDCEGGERCADVAGTGNVCVGCTVENEYSLVDDDDANCLRGFPSPAPARTPVAATSSAGSSDPAPAPEIDIGAWPGTSATLNDGVCVGTHHLHALRAEELVFARHRVTNVLCDGHGSCATAGHIVMFRGRAMRMGRYCETEARGGCESRRMTVNSPRWQAARRVASATEGLEFTALAARWGSHVEELLLRVAVGFGA